MVHVFDYLMVDMGAVININKLWHVCGVTLYTWVHQQYNNSTIVLATIFKELFCYEFGAPNILHT